MIRGMKEKIKRLPPWLVQKTPKSGHIHSMKSSLRSLGLHTVCESAHCPNLGRCFKKPTATFLIMGDRCTRNCAFCNVETAVPLPLDRSEPENLASHAATLGLKHVVITSVTRDDLPDGGLDHFLACVAAVKAKLPHATVEILTPDFKGVGNAVSVLAKADIEIFNHNLETVPRLYKSVRPGADYVRSLQLLRDVKKAAPHIVTKSGLMVGLGETTDEVCKVFDDLVAHSVDAVTVGQYMRPSLKHHPVIDYIHPDLFAELAESARTAGFRYVACDPLVRSSFNAEEMMSQIKKAESE